MKTKIRFFIYSNAMNKHNFTIILKKLKSGVELNNRVLLFKNYIRIRLLL